MQRNYFRMLVIGIVIILLIIILAAVAGHRSSEPAEEIQSDAQEEAAETAAGVRWLESLEQQDPEQVVEQLKILRRQNLEAQRAERLRQLETGEVSVWSMFDDYVILGDSRAVGFYVFDYLPQERVLAEGGSTILDLEAHIPDIVELNPSLIFLCYGLNDVSIGNWPTPEDYTEEFRRIIGEVQAALPDADIYISSILPARDPAFETASAWHNIPYYSAAVEEMCKEIDRCWYVDNDALAEEYADMWDDDGIHVNREFYPHWAANLLTEVYSSDLDWDADVE